MKVATCSARVHTSCEWLPQIESFFRLVKKNALATASVYNAGLLQAGGNSGVGETANAVAEEGTT
jgi:hypothetical protein